MTKALDIQVLDRGAKRMLARYEHREMIKRLRRGTRAGAAVYRVGLRARAKSDPLIPDSFAKTRSKSGVRFGDIRSEVGPKSPLFSIFEGGAGSHDIEPRSGSLLIGPAGDRWRGRAFAARRVRHPGMRARPLAAPVFRDREGAAKKAVAVAVFGESSLGVFGLGSADG